MIHPSRLHGPAHPTRLRLAAALLTVLFLACLALVVVFARSAIAPGLPSDAFLLRMGLSAWMMLMALVCAFLAMNLLDQADTASREAKGLTR